MGNTRYGNNAVISGSGRMSGGKYDEVKISGSCETDGDIEARIVKVSGSANFWGSVSAGSVKVSGSCRFKGSIDADECRFSGSTEVAGHLHARSLKASGSLSCRDAVRAEEIKISGHLRAEGDVESESFAAAGGFKINGLLNASQVNVSMNGMCYAREIGGDRIEAKIAPLNLYWRFVVWLAELFGRGSRVGLRSEQIEGTDVALEWTEARFVRGQRVHVGRGCNIDLVEYTETAFIDPEARVKEARQIS